MQVAWIYSLLSVLFISLISFVGIITLPVKEKKLQNFLLYFVSFSAGGLLGDVFIHLLPKVVEELGFGLNISLYVLFGIVMTFVTEKFIHWRHHQNHTGHRHIHPVTTMTLLGDGVHNFIDGLIIGASYLVSMPVGIATTVAVVLHEIPQEIGNFGVLLHGGYPRSKALWFNFLSALTAIVGSLVALSIGETVAGSITFLTAFAAGNFIYIAASDLIPELHKEVSLQKSFMQFTTMLLGIAIMLLLLLLEK